MVRNIKGDVRYETCDKGESSSWRSVSLCELAMEYGFRVGGIAEHLGISARQLQRDFQSGLGIRPKTWLIRQRMIEALALVEEGIEPSEIADRLGYSRRFLFMRDFKETYGVWPYRAFLAESSVKEQDDSILAAV